MHIKTIPDPLAVSLLCFDGTAPPVAVQFLFSSGCLIAQASVMPTKENMIGLVRLQEKVTDLKTDSIIHV